MKLKLKVWRQQDANSTGNFEEYQLENISEGSSFLEMMDILSEKLVSEGREPVAFDHDCREGICGMCSMTINGIPHGPEGATTTCQLHMRHFRDGQTITIEPWRAKPFPIVKDLVVDRSAFDRIIQSGGFITGRAGSAVDANAIPCILRAHEPSRRVSSGARLGSGARRSLASLRGGSSTCVHRCAVARVAGDACRCRRGAKGSP